jgi:hypothetical protein
MKSRYAELYPLQDREDGEGQVLLVPNIPTFFPIEVVGHIEGQFSPQILHHYVHVLFWAPLGSHPSQAGAQSIIGMN